MGLAFSTASFLLDAYLPKRFVPPPVRRLAILAAGLISAPPLFVPKPKIQSARQIGPDDGSAEEDATEFLGKSAR